MTTREFYTAIVEGATVSAELAEKAVELVAAMDARNEKRRNTENNTQKENSALIEQIVANMEADKVYTCRELADKYSTEEKPMTTQKMSGVMRVAVKRGLVELIEDYKPEGGKAKDKCNGYKVVTH